MYKTPRFGLRTQLRHEKRLLARKLRPTRQVQVSPSIDVAPMPVDMAVEYFAEPSPDTVARMTTVGDLTADLRVVTIEMDQGDPTPADTEVAEMGEAIVQGGEDAYRAARERAKRDRYNQKRKEMRAKGLKPTR